MSPNPIAYVWDGEAFTPLPRFAGRCDDEFLVGQRYTLEVIEQRSAQTHRHFFAAVHDAWLNLSEDIADEFPSSEHLRAWGLVKAGFADKTVIRCASNDDAIRLAALTKGDAKIRIVEVSGRIVTVWTPHSQSMRAMGRATFQKSKDAVLDAIAQLCGYSAAALKENAGSVA